MALTIKEIENAKPKDKKYKMLDGGGLSLLVLPTGTKLWLWRYQFNGSEKNMTFGEYPVVAPKEARDLHYAAKKLLATGSSLHRCLERHGISRLPDVEVDKPRKKKFDTYPIGFFHIDLAEVRTAEGKLYLFVAVDRTSKFAVVELVEKADTRAAAAFLEALVKAIPYRIHIVLTDNGIQFADLPKNRKEPTARFRGHPFNRLCLLHGIEHRLTKPNHPWTNGQVERMNRTIKEATVKRYFYDTHDQLKAHLNVFLAAYNFARRLKTLKGLTPYEYLCKLWTQTPDIFILNPIHQIPGLTIRTCPR